jgi:hypothetical protein
MRERGGEPEVEVTDPPVTTNPPVLSTETQEETGGDVLTLGEDNLDITVPPVVDGAGSDGDETAENEMLTELNTTTVEIEMIEEEIPEDVTEPESLSLLFTGQ